MSSTKKLKIINDYIILNIDYLQEKTLTYKEYYTD